VTDIHAGPRVPLVPGRCTWRWHWEDVDFACHDQVVPGTALCADHYIEFVHLADGQPHA
jgi:hypothetical protein